MLSGFWILCMNYVSKYLKIQCNKTKIILTKMFITKLPDKRAFVFWGQVPAWESPSYLKELPSRCISVGEEPLLPYWSRTWFLMPLTVGLQADDSGALHFEFGGATEEQFVVATVEVLSAVLRPKCPDTRTISIFAFFLLGPLPSHSLPWQYYFYSALYFSYVNI